MLYRYRCKRTVNGVRHYRRITLKRPIGDYVRPPKCPEWGEGFTWLDKYPRIRNKKAKCECDGMPDNFPHKKGARMNIEGVGLFFCNYRKLTNEEQEELYNERYN